MEKGQELVAKPKAPKNDQAAMLTPSQLTKQMNRDQELRKVVNEYIKNNMVDGKDFGSITVKGVQSKPSLLKPGAEKFCSLLKVRATFRKDTDTWEMLGNTPGVVAYICELVDSRGRVVGEGRGSAKVDMNGSDFDINKVVKIAEKRAQVDAVLRAGGLSDFFTQDMEDAPKTVTGPQEAKVNQGGTLTGDMTESQAKLIEKLAKEKMEHPEELEMPKTKAEASGLISKLLNMESVNV